MTAAPAVHLTLPARPENVAVARQALGGLASALGLDATVLIDMKMALSEACTNVVVHAYPDGGGDMEIELHPEGRTLLMVVRDAGAGIKPRPEKFEHALGLGLPLMASLSEDFEIHGGGDAGTEVRMTFPLRRDEPRAE
jgi:anti-sigma regulatory factor (Ser/Thr protein kinase)